MNYLPILSAALSRGGHYADIFFENTLANSLVLQDGIVSQASQTVSYGAGIRTLAGDRTGYAYTMDLSERELLKAAHSAACIADGGATTQPLALSATAPLTENRYPILRPWTEIGVEATKDMLMALDAFARGLDPRVVKVRAAINNRTQEVRFANSLGETFLDVRPRATLIVIVVMQDGTQTEMGYASEAASMGGEFLTTERIQRVAREAVRRATIMFEAVQPEGGEIPVVMAAGASEIGRAHV